VSSTWYGSVRRHLVVLGLSAALQAGLGAVAARVWFAEHHTLHANGRWISTKTTLDRGLLGAFAYLTERQALAGGRLDLAAWHGFNEVIYKDEIDAPCSIEFDFSVGKGAYLVAILNRDASGAGTGLRLSASSRYPSAFLRFSADGAFVAKRRFTAPKLSDATTHHALITVAGDELLLAVDGRALGSFAERMLARQRFGFRGGYEHALVDNVVVTLADGRRIIERFDAPPMASRVVPIAAGLGAVAAPLLFLLLRGWRRDDDTALGFAFLLTDLTLLVLCGLFYAFVVIRAGWYPRLGEVDREAEAYFKKGDIDRVLAEIQERCAVDSVPAPFRILFVGSSQTWGAGARRDADTFVAVLEDLLRRSHQGGPPVECINGGVSSARAADLAPILECQWLKLKPQVVVIDLSSNDRSNGASFVAAVRAMVEASLAAGACPVLVQEPNAYGTVDKGLIERHLDLYHISQDYGVPLIDLHRYLLGVDDRGFVWWDKVHLTSFGQRLVAEKLRSELERLGLVAASGPGGAAG